MGQVKWNASFQYNALFRIPVEEFSVKGGTVRTIRLEEANDIGLLSELEQAKTFKNITVALLLTEHFHRHITHPTTNWLYDILEISARDQPISFDLFVDGQIGKSTTQAFRLICKDARIMQPQETSKPAYGGNRVLVIKLSTPDAVLIQGSHGKYIEAE